MLTPMDIHNKEFKRVFRGYNEDEVNEFLDKVVSDFERLYRENNELKDKISIVNEKVESYSNIEKTLQNTLIVAQSTADEVLLNSRKKSEIMAAEAQEQARKIIEEANNKVLTINKEYEDLRKQVQIFKTRFKTLLESELDSLNEELKDI